MVFKAIGRLFSKIKQGLAKTRGGFLSRLFGRTREEPLTAEFLDELEEGLVRADLSVSLVDPLMAQVRDLATTGELKTVPKALDAVRDVLVAELSGKDSALRTSEKRPRVVLVVGVNGSGKTTTAAKLAKRLKDAGETPLLAAADTFRAAAIQQLEAWASRVDVPIVSGRPDGDPAAVVFDAINAATARRTRYSSCSTEQPVRTRYSRLGSSRRTQASRASWSRSWMGPRKAARSSRSFTSSGCR